MCRDDTGTENGRPAGAGRSADSRRRRWGMEKERDRRYGKKLADFAATQVQDIAMAERLARKEEQRRYSAAE